MNIYFLVEGKRTERKVYPAWLKFLIPELTRVNSYDEVQENNYYLFSGQGFPSLLDTHLPKCLEEIEEMGNYDYIVVCLDGDDEGVEKQKEIVKTYFEKATKQVSITAQLEVIVQNKCIETWFLGNSKIFKQNPISKELAEYIRFYDLKENDPELMEKPASYKASTASFHGKYLNLIFQERNIKYSKVRPGEVLQEYFLAEIQARAKATGHLQSFQNLVDFCERVRQEIAERK